MRVSVTERQLYKRCRRKWNYASYNRQSLTRIINSPALDLGTIVHQVLADWTADPTLDPITHYAQVAQSYFDDIIEQYTTKIGCAPSQSETQPTQGAIVLGLSMISNYKNKWHTPLPPGFSLVENELSLIQPVPGTEHCTCDNQDVTHCMYQCNSCYRDMCMCLQNEYMCECKKMHELECTFDGVMEDVNGDLYIIERKTFSRTPSIDELNDADQFLAYQWALDRQFPGRVVGLAYDGLLKKAQPVKGKTLDDLFLRRILLRSRNELDEFSIQLAQELNEMANPLTSIYKNVPWQGCPRWECSFLDVCRAQSRGDTSLQQDLLRMFVRSERKSHLDVSTEE